MAQATLHRAWFAIISLTHEDSIGYDNLIFGCVSFILFYSFQSLPILYLPLYNTHFFSQNEHVKLGVRIIHGVLYLVKQRKIWSEIWGLEIG